MRGAAGATGVGAGIDYMGPNTVHIGFGTRAVWGAGGSAANAPAWIIAAAKAGWLNVMGADDPRVEESLDSDEDEFEEAELDNRNA